MKTIGKGPKELESPKGLVKVTRKRESFEKHVVVEKVSSDQLILRPRDPQKRVRADLEQAIAAIRQRAMEVISNDGHDTDKLRSSAPDKEELDEVWVAEKTLSKLQKCETALSHLDEVTRPDDIRLFAHQAVLESLRAGLVLSSLFTVENEDAIVAREESIAGAKVGAEIKKQNTRLRDIEMAAEFVDRLQKRPNGSGLSEFAIKRDIGRKRGLKKSAAIAAVDRGLKHLAAEENCPAPGADRTLNAVRKSELPKP